MSLAGHMPVQSQYRLGDLWVLCVFRSFICILGSSVTQNGLAYLWVMSSACGHVLFRIPSLGESKALRCHHWCPQMPSVLLQSAAVLLCFKPFFLYKVNMIDVVFHCYSYRLRCFLVIMMLSMSDGVIN